MPPSAPLCVPIEISPDASHTAPRVFRLAVEVAVDRLMLAGGLPDDPEWLRGTLHVGFHLPGDPETTIRCAARAEEIVDDVGTDGEHATLRALRLIAVPPDAATRIESYVDERLLTA